MYKSFQAEEVRDSNYWYGYYDTLSKKYNVFSVGRNEPINFKLKVIAEETLDDFEARLNRFISNYFYGQVQVRITAIADDYSLIKQSEKDLTDS